MQELSRNAYALIVLAGLAGAVLFLASHPGQAYSQSSTNTILGYAWSDTSGWVDLNCANSATCGVNDFGLSYASDGTLSGYAWSDNVGWVSANTTDLAGCPTSPCTAILSQAGLSGWLKALSANGTTTKVFWNIANVTSCSTTGTNGDSWTGTSSGSAGEISGLINQHTIYTLSCTGLDASIYSENAEVNVVPDFQER